MFALECQKVSWCLYYYLHVYSGPKGIKRVRNWRGARGIDLIKRLDLHVGNSQQQQKATWR